MDILLGAAAFCIGAILSSVNYGISKALLTRLSNGLAAVFLIRQTVSIAFLAALYLVGRSTGWNLWALLIGGALGITLPGFLFTAKLLKTTANTNTGKEHADG